MDYMVTEVAQILKEDLDKNENCTGYGEPQAFFELDNGRSIEVVLEQEGLSPDEYFYSALLHCTELEFDNKDFNSTCGIIDRYASSGLSIEALWEVVGAALACNQATPVATHSKAPIEAQIAAIEGSSSLKTNAKTNYINIAQER